MAITLNTAPNMQKYAALAGNRSIADNAEITSISENTIGVKQRGTTFFKKVVCWLEDKFSIFNRRDKSIEDKFTKDIKQSYGKVSWGKCERYVYHCELDARPMKVGDIRKALKALNKNTDTVTPTDFVCHFTKLKASDSVFDKDKGRFREGAEFRVHTGGEPIDNVLLVKDSDMARR